MFVGVARHPGSQDEVSRGVEPLEAARAQPAKDRRVKGTPKSSKPRKKHRYLRLLPEALIRFGGFRKRTKAKSSVSKKPGKVDDSLEQPCGLGCLVSTCCECCNNIRCFMIFYCILLICQGEPEGGGLLWRGQLGPHWRRREREYGGGRPGVAQHALGWPSLRLLSDFSRRCRIKV